MCLTLYDLFEKFENNFLSELSSFSSLRFKFKVDEFDQYDYEWR